MNYINIALLSPSQLGGSQQACVWTEGVDGVLSLALLCALGDGGARR
jgi:hypothetical protein